MAAEREKVEEREQRIFLERPLHRYFHAIFAFFVMVGLLLTRAVYIQIYRGESYSERWQDQRTKTVRRRAERGLIYDRDMHILADNQRTYLVSLDSTVLRERDRRRLLGEVSQLLNLDRERLRRMFRRRQKYQVLQRHLDDAKSQQLRELIREHNIHGLHFEATSRRVYPKGRLAGALVGFTNLYDGQGRSGIEYAYERYLSAEANDFESTIDAHGREIHLDGSMPIHGAQGYSLQLTIDLRLQQIAENHLAQQVRAQEAQGGVVVIMEPKTGDVLALAQTPDFDPNRYSEYPSAAYQNIPVTHRLEPGSTIKPFLVAAALEAGKITERTVFPGNNGRFLLGQHVIRDTHALDEMTTLDVIKYSSNVGAIQIGQLLGREGYYSALRAFGFGVVTQVGLYPEVPGFLRPVRQLSHVHLGSMSYGYGLDTTPMHLTQAMSVIANGGHLVRPRLVSHVLDSEGQVVREFLPEIRRRVISAETAATVTRALQSVTDLPPDNGTGWRARVSGYPVAGKTGTSHKISEGSYSNELYNASFIGFVPADDPRLVIYVNFDEPRRSHFGGTVAAPVFSAIAAEALPFLGVTPNPDYMERRRHRQREPEQVLEGHHIHDESWWSKDALLIDAPPEWVVPDLSGRSLAEVVQASARLNLELSIEGAGLVRRQSPRAGALIPEDGILRVFLARPGSHAWRNH